MVAFPSSVTRDARTGILETALLDHVAGSSNANHNIVRAEEILTAFLEVKRATHDFALSLSGFSSIAQTDDISRAAVGFIHKK